MTKQEICNKLDVSTKTFERFLSSVGKEIGKTTDGSAHEKDYSDNVLRRFKKWLIANQLSQGKPTGAKNLTAAVRDTGTR
jgi:hypothetical protein